MTNGNDERLKRGLGVARQSREVQDRKVTQNRELSDADRLEMFRMAMFNDALPNIPDIPGYHVCWLSTENPRDTIQRREMLGYIPVTQADAPGLTNITVKTGEYAGLIAVKEMVAYKLPMSLYQAFMKEAHHDAPRREEEKISEAAESLAAQAGANAGPLIEDEGFQELRQNVSAPSHFD